MSYHYRLNAINLAQSGLPLSEIDWVQLSVACGTYESLHFLTKKCDGNSNHIGKGSSGMGGLFVLF
jgi:hypothetical protein